MPDSKRYNDWYTKAKSEYSSAVILAEHGGDNAVVAFLCQQAIEKVLKGFILKHTEKLIDGHSLIYLCRKSAQIDESFNKFMKTCAYVNQFYIETRYPADTPMEISDAEVSECIRAAEEILIQVSK